MSEREFRIFVEEIKRAQKAKAFRYEESYLSYIEFCHRSIRHNARFVDKAQEEYYILSLSYRIYDDTRITHSIACLET